MAPRGPSGSSATATAKAGAAVGDAVRAYGEAVAAYQDAGDYESAVRVLRWLEAIDPGEAPE